MKKPASTSNGATKGWLKKLGWLGFLFFFLKGLVWLAIFMGLGKWISG